jgi:Spondin_N
VDSFIEGDTFFVNQAELDKNFVHLPPLHVSADHSYISGIAGISPSPDWYSGFYLFNTIKEGDQIFWDSFMIKTYPWDAGTDDGTKYTDYDRDTDPPGLITRFTVENTNGDIFKSPLGDKIRHLAEWECILHTCPMEEPECIKPDWPPANGCDILRYPECATPCNPDTEKCEECKRDDTKEAKVFHKNCCLAGRQPMDGKCDDEEKEKAAASGAAARLVGLALSLGSLGLFAFL